MLLLYFVAVPGALVVRRPLLAFHYAFARSLEDVVALSLLRAAAVTLAYWSGAGAKRHKCVPCIFPPIRVSLDQAHYRNTASKSDSHTARFSGMLRITAWATHLQQAQFHPS